MTKVFVNGTFDVLHRGHLALLNYARSQGDEVAVAVDTDARVKEMKGESRPVNCCLDRMEMLRALKFVDKVFSFSSDEELENLIKTYQPDIMIVGSDWKDKSVIGSMYAAELRFFDRLENYATSKTIQSIIDRG
jgi:D-beta-D-heptose 7-phosphate kinase/D-beta-D-heptose 1-phosphate adenosyltransferase|tara:strand:+ start:6016 stop:6417 length:402 start_codon:yes stop_codon:yes gene_type:complete